MSNDIIPLPIMKRFLALLFLVFLLGTSFFFGKILADTDCANTNDLSAIENCLADFTKALNQSKAATAPLESQLNSMRTQIAEIKNRVSIIEDDVAVKKRNIDEGYKNLAKQTDVLDKAIADYYIKSYYNSPLLTLVSASSAQNMTQIMEYQKAATDQDKLIITNIALSIADLEQKKKDLESEEARLSVVKANLDTQSAKLDEIVQGAKKYQASLSSQIASLTAKQQEILGQRLSALGIPLFASSGGSCSSDLTNGKNAGFTGGYGFFTYGVPNRVGLSQYGAWGRAKAGQDYTQILQAYYNYDSLSGADQSIQIRVDGYGSYSLEDYVKRIYEVPDSWTDNNSAALKAQAIAARSYVLAATNNGQSSICATDSCQVFKPDPKGGNWESAVNATAGQVMMQGGNPIKAWFSSTHGGYAHSSGDIGWSGTSWTKNALDASGSVNSFSDLKNNAYDKDSPWFYCDWGARSDYGGTAWLKPDEMADIANVVMLAQADSSVNEHLYQTDKPNPAGTDTWDATRVKAELQNRGRTPFNSVSGISISADFGSGKTTSVSITGDTGTQSLPGDFFKTYFDLRAPANIQIVGPLYNVERN